MARSIINYFFLITFFLLFIPISAQAQHRVNVIPGQSIVKFTSKAPLNTFEGKTKNVTGWVDFNPKNLNTAKAQFSVDLASIDTGNRLRNKHMREKFLQTNQYPKMVLDLERVHAKEISANSPVTFTIDSRMTLHGVTRGQQIKVNVLHDLQKGEMRISANFSINLSDYNIKQPSFLGMFVKNTLPISVKLVLR